jgi:hypothetical protein
MHQNHSVQMEAYKFIKINLNKIFNISFLFNVYVFSNFSPRKFIYKKYIFVVYNYNISENLIRLTSKRNVN